MKQAPMTQMVLPGMGPRGHFEEISRARLPTNTTANRHAVHRWFNFIAGFAPEFVAKQCPTDSGGLLLDPFAGCGTSLVVAQSLGHHAIGYEPHPFFARIARAKIESVTTPARIGDISETLLAGINGASGYAEVTESAGVYLRKLFDSDILKQLLGARRAIESYGLIDDDLAFLILSRVLDMCCKAKTDGIYKAPTSSKKASDPSEAIKHVVSQILSDTTESRDNPRLPASSIHQQTSEEMGAVHSGSVDVVVTSPPYLNNFDFAEMTRMYLYFWGICGSWREITEKVRSRLVVNTTTALAGHRDLQMEYRSRITPELLPELDGIVGALGNERRVRAGKKEYDLLVYPYFAQMSAVMREVQRCLVVRGTVHVVISDAAFYGVHVASPHLLALAMSSMGFARVECEKLRDRGHRWVLEKRDGSPVGLGEYHISAERGG